MFQYGGTLQHAFTSTTRSTYSVILRRQNSGSQIDQAYFKWFLISTSVTNAIMKVSDGSTYIADFQKLKCQKNPKMCRSIASNFSFIISFLNYPEVLKGRYLTKTGENYGSIMLAITAKVQRLSGDVEELALVAKLPPITNDFFWNIFQPERICRTEIAVYKYVAPALRQLQWEMGLDEEEIFDGFSIYYGSRVSLDPDSTRVDRNAVLVKENLQASGFKPGNREKIFDLSHAKFILKEMAKYHALPIALRVKRPQVFEEDVRPYFRHFNIDSGLGEKE
uniref:Uncharacterized protein n=1 Tax=Glossina pallidipes TaxID=7398 RepID=A0A1B0ADY4_GLOPL